MGLFDELLKRNRGRSAKPPMTVARAQEVVEAYGAFMETSPVSPGTVADVNELPYPKEVIKQALWLLLVVTKPSNLREALKVGYWSLADWQPGVGPVRFGFDFAKVDPAKDPRLYAEQIVAEGDAAEKWLAVAETERDALVAELQAMGMW